MSDARTSQDASLVVSCQHGERCGGCSMLGVPLAEQLVRKAASVQAALAPYPELRGATAGGEASPAPAADAAALRIAPVTPTAQLTRYRTRAKLVVSGALIGLYGRGGHALVDIPGCQVLSPALLEMAAILRARLSAVLVPMTGVDLREVRDGAEGSVLVTLVGHQRARAALERFARELGELPQVRGVAVSLSEPGAPRLLGSAPRCVHGADSARDSLSTDAPYFYASHGSFVQAHRGAASALAAHLLSQLALLLGEPLSSQPAPAQPMGLKGLRVLELYAGSGALGLQLSQAGARPLLVEAYAPALALVSRAAREQRLEGIATRVGDVQDVLAQLVREGERFDAVVVNPPRRGLPAAVRAALCALQPKLVLYVSCDPQTLARDLADLAHQGLHACSLLPFDMMPLSDDVESVVTLRPAAAVSPRVLYEDERLLVVDKPPHLPTIPQDEHASSVLAQLAAAHALPELAAVHRLDIGTSGVCLFAKRRSDVAALSAALAAGSKRYTALVRGITHVKGTLKTPLREDGKLKDATTRYTRKTLRGGHSLLHVRPEQGRTHQVRKHLASIGHPVLGDERHGDPASNRHFEHKHGLDRTFLHLSRVELVHPATAQPLVLEAPLPGDLQHVLDALRS